MGVLKINNLLVKCNVGYDPHQTNFQQDFIINIQVEYNSFIEEESDAPEDAFDVQQLINEIVGRAESGHFNLVEAFTRMVLNTVMEFQRIESAEVEVKRVQTIHYAAEMSFSLSASKK